MGAGTDKTLHDRSQTPESAARRKRTGAPSEHFFLFLSLTKKRCKDDGMQKTVCSGPERVPTSAEGYGSLPSHLGPAQAPWRRGVTAVQPLNLRCS
jgi:hypothetical protein